MNLDAFAEYSSAWLVIVAAALLGALCLNSMLKRLGGVRSAVGRSLRWAIVMTVLAAFTLPVALPNAEQINAPAFIVLLFESSFQAQGDPAQARRMMLAGLPLVFVGVFTISVLAHIVWRKLRVAGLSTPRPTDKNEAK
jgi:uncharacterized membrane protein YhaH (DUF805 family)